MPRRCIAAGCDSVGGKGCILHKFPQDEAIKRKWIKAIKQQRSNWDGPSPHSLLCSKHFTENCFVTEGVRFRDEMGMPTAKCLKPDAVPTIFARSVDRRFSILMQKTLQYCKTIDDDDKPTLPTAPPPLARAYVHPDKDTIPLFSRYKK